MIIKIDKSNAEEWNKNILNKKTYNVFESYEWGEVKNNSGWKVLRLSYYSNNSKNFIQVFYKKIFNLFTLVWVPYGFDDYQNLIDAEVLRNFLKKNISTKFIYTRYNFHLPKNNLQYHRLINNNLKKSSYQIMSGQSVTIDLIKTDDEWVKSIRPKHRYYLKKSLKQNTYWTLGTDKFHMNEFFILYKKMHKIKKIKKNLIGYNQIFPFIKFLPNNHFIILGKINNKVVAGAIIIFFGNKSHYYLAATNDYGREKMISYSMIKKIRSILIEKNIKQFDFGGIDITNKKLKGINHFKLGFCETHTNIAGEYENSNLFFLNTFINNLLKLRYA
jgi:peptidoglycan pentaglycine glycine transferase (the first glycine)